jgi:flagellar assembly factor FliW
MPVCQTKYHGAIRFEPEQVLHLPAGLYGFPDEKEFLLLELPSSRPLVFLQSVRTPGLCFISLPAQVVEPSYQLNLRPSESCSLGYAPDAPPVMGKDVLCLALLTMREKQETTANLLGPVVIDIARHRGLQVLVEGNYSHQHPIASMEWKRAC